MRMAIQFYLLSFVGPSVQEGTGPHHTQAGRRDWENVFFCPNMLGTSKISQPASRIQLRHCINNNKKNKRNSTLEMGRLFWMTMTTTLTKWLFPAKSHILKQFPATSSCVKPTYADRWEHRHSMQRACQTLRSASAAVQPARTCRQTEGVNRSYQDM